MTIHEPTSLWRPTWTQAVTDFRGEDDEPPFHDITVRMTVPASIGGSQVRVELSNRFGDGPVLVGHGAVTVGARSLDVVFDGEPSVEIPAGGSRWRWSTPSWGGDSDGGHGRGHAVRVAVGYGVAVAEQIALLVLAAALIAVAASAAIFTIRSRGASPPVDEGVVRGPVRQSLALLFWLLMVGLSALLTWANETPLHLTTSTLVSLVLVGVFYIIPCWRAADRFLGKPWNRRLSIDFTISVLTLVFSGWGLIELALRDTGDLEERLVTALLVVLVAVVVFSALLRRVLGRAAPRLSG